MDAEVAIYVIGVMVEDGFSAPSKIGIAEKPHARVKTIQTSCPFKIAPFFFVRAPSRDFAAIIEQRAHETFESYRLAGEWFDLHPVDAAIGVLIIMRESLEHLFPEEDVPAYLKQSGMTDAINRLWPVWQARRSIGDMQGVRDGN